MADFVANNNFFVYGEVGKRLAGIRDSEIAKGSARYIRNMVITELGNLKVAKQWLPVSRPDLVNIVQVLDTRYTFYIVVTTTQILTLSKNGDTVLYTLALKAPINANDNVKMFEDSLIITGKAPQVYEFDPTTGNIGVSDFLSLLKFPVSDKEVVEMEVFKVYEITVGEKKEFRVTSLSMYKDPKLETKTDGVYLYETGIKLDRVYKQSRSTINEETITGIYAGLTIGVMQRFYVNEDKKSYILGNSPAEFTGATWDPLYGSDYFTNLNPAGANGALTYGEIKSINVDIIDAGLFKGRMYIIQDNVFYFSKIGDYFDFRNDTKDDSPFYFKPSPINNQKPFILTSKVGNAIYVATDKGVYVIGYGVKFLSPTSYTVYIAGEIPATRECELIADNFYYISGDGVLKCVQPVPNELGYENFQVFNVEKYSHQKTSQWLTKIIIDGTQKLVNGTNMRYIEIYDTLDINQFRKVSIDMPDHNYKMFGYNEDLVTSGTVLNVSDVNYVDSYLYLNPPPITTKVGGAYMNDYASKIQRVAIKTLDGEEAIKGIEIMGIRCNKLGNTNDDYGVYKVEKSQSVGAGVQVHITSNANSAVLEILGIDTFITVAGD